MDGVGAGCLRFAVRLTPPPRKTRFRLLARLYRVWLVAHRASMEVFRGTRYISSSLPKLFLAQYEILTHCLTMNGCHPRLGVFARCRRCSAASSSPLRP